MTFAPRPDDKKQASCGDLGTASWEEGTVRADVRGVTGLVIMRRSQFGD